MVTAYIGLGANVGDASAQIVQAVELLSEKTRVLACSPLYETRPFGLAGQPNFLNGAVMIQAELSPEGLRALTKEIEDRMGRVRGIRNGPRSIDLDILLYGDLVMDGPEVIIPHRDLTTRDFVLRPLLDLDPGLCDPRSGHGLQSCLEAIPEEDWYVLSVATTI